MLLQTKDLLNLAIVATDGAIGDVKDIYFDALLAMEPPAYQGYGAVHNEKAKVFQAMRPLQPDDVVRGQYAGYRKEQVVAKGSDVETFCALRLFIDSWPQEVGSHSTNFADPRFSKYLR